MARRRGTSIAKAMQEVRKDVLERKKDPRRVFGVGHWSSAQDPEHPLIEDPWKLLNIKTGGFHEFNFILLCGRQKVGKSTLGAQFIPNIAQQCPDGKRVVVFTLEMSVKAYSAKMAASVAGVRDLTGLKTGYVSDEDLEKFLVASEWVESLPIEYFEQKDVADVADVRTILEEKPTYFWMLDNFSNLVRGDHYSAAATSQMLCSISHTVATGMVIVHLTRSSVGKRPDFTSIAHTDQLGRDADVAFLLYRMLQDVEGINPKDLENGEPAELIIKQRDLASSVLELFYDTGSSTYYELSSEDLEANEPIIVKPPSKRGKKSA